jgi:isoleucyl-tRNA synthetase
LLDGDQQVTMQYVPLGSTLGASFGKDTWRIIGAAKQGNATLLDGWVLQVTSGDDAWELEPHMYEVRYSWFDGNNQIVEEGIMVELNLDLTQELIHEWYAREISRFLNQMRKDADYEVSDRVQCGFETESDIMSWIIATHESYLQTEALLQSIERSSLVWDHSAEFEVDDIKVTFTLKR